jgi:hydroxymethylpyrimidine pyrophosphatase-like HAD family hydrolase
MWSKELVERIAKHKVVGKEILNYANSILGVRVRLRFPNINKLAIELEKVRQTENKEQKIREKNDPAMFKKKIKNNSPRFYHKLEKMIEQYREEDKAIENLKVSVSNFPDYIQRLINVELVYPDGKKATGTLNAIAAFIRDDCKDIFKRKITWEFLQKTFLKANGDKWGESTARMAVTHAYKDLAR